MSQSLKKIAEILKCLSEGTHRFADICASVSLPKSTVHRLLNSMIQSDFALQSPADRHYYLGPLVFSLTANPLHTHQHLLTASQDELKRLRDTTRETVAIHIAMGGYKMCLEEIESPERIRYAKGKGVVDSSYFGAAGKLLLAQLERDELQKLLNNKKSSTAERLSDLDPDTLLRQLQEIRKQGYAETIGERTPGSRLHFRAHHELCAAFDLERSCAGGPLPKKKTRDFKGAEECVQANLEEIEIGVNLFQLARGMCPRPC